MQQTTIEQLQYQIRKLNKKLICSADIKVSSEALTGSANCYKLGVNNTNGAIYYKDDSGNWQAVPGGVGAGIQSVVAGTNITINNADPQNPIISSTGGGGGGSTILKVLSSAFTTPTDYSNPSLLGKDLGIFLNEINRYLEDSEWQSTGTGIRILIPGFDATIDTYTLFITPVTTIS